MSTRLHSAIGVVLLLTFLVLRPACALDFDFVKIADTSTPVPVEGSVFGTLQAPVLDGYQVAFRGNRAVGGGGGGRDGIYVSSGGTLTRIVGDTINIPSGSGTFNALSDPSLSQGNVAFRGVDGTNTLSGVYTNINGITRVADETTNIPSGSGVFNDLGAPSLQGSEAAFYGVGTSQAGIYSNVNGLNAVANLSTPIPSGSGNFTSFGTTPAHRDGAMAFLGSGAGQSGIYTNTSGLVAVANTSTAVPSGSGNFTGFTNPTLSFGSVAFRAAGTGGQNGIYSDSGGLQRVADLTTAVPAGTGNFTNFGDNVSIDGGSIAFSASGSGQSGVYTNYGGTLAAVVNNATFIDGKRVTGIPRGLSRQSINQGNVAFYATFSDGSSGIYVAEQSYSWATNASGTWDTASNWSFGASPRTVVYTSIQPNGGAVITGPASATTVRGMNLGAQYNGVAELRLQPSGQLNVNEFLNVYENGKLNLNGGVAASNYGTYNYGDLDLGNGGQLSGGLNNYGTLHGSGTIAGNLYNAGRIQAINSQMRFLYQVQNVETNARVDARNAILQFDDGLSNSKQISFSFGTSDVFGKVENIDGGKIIVSGNSNVTFYDEVSHFGSEIRVSTGSTAVFFGNVHGPGAFSGAGTILIEGSYSPGASPASVSLQNDVTLGANATLNIELGGAFPGDQYDQVNVAGDLSLGGTLKVSLLNGFLPAGDSSFDILNWGSLSGTFSSIELPQLTSGHQWNASQLYTSGVLSIIGGGLLGDYNQDGTVNAADYTVYRNRKAGIGGTTLPNDAGAPGVTIEDYNYWKAHYGATGGSGNGQAAGTSQVPEPATVLLALLAIAAAGSIRR